MAKKVRTFIGSSEASVYTETEILNRHINRCLYINHSDVLDTIEPFSHQAEAVESNLFF